MISIPDSPASAADLEALLVALRPKLHRYCARMTGSVIDGEDVLQDALIKAVESFASAGPLHNPEGWLFRIAHNTALDFLRRRNRQQALRSGEEVDMIADPSDAIISRLIAGTSLRTFMRLPVAQRSSVILMDVLGGSLWEVCEVMDFSLPAVKVALHRGRAQLRELAGRAGRSAAGEAVAAGPRPPQRLCRALQCAGFRRHPRHDIGRCASRPRQQDAAERQGRGFPLFGNYSGLADWHLVPGLLEGRPAILVFDPDAPGARPKYFMLLQWSADKVATIRDFRHAPYIIDGAEYLV
jgi:RNA polymerase sigma-70 factor, ECF subfamily